VVSSVKITTDEKGQQFVEVSVKKGEGYEDAAKGKDLLLSMRGTWSDWDSGQVVIVATDKNGNVVTVETNRIPVTDPQRERKHSDKPTEGFAVAKWEQGDDANSVRTRIPFDKSAEQIGVTAVYTDIFSGWAKSQNAPAIIGSWTIDVPTGQTTSRQGDLKNVENYPRASKETWCEDQIKAVSQRLKARLGPNVTLETRGWIEAEKRFRENSGFDIRVNR
jgi:hypothetical protein